jgi:hypothetical protein
MPKYTTILTDVESVFANTLWSSNNISAYPSNYMVPATKFEFVKIEVLPLTGDGGYNRDGIKGQVIIQVYVKANQGIKRLMEIADLLDTNLQCKHLGTGTQTQESSLSVLGIDKDNPKLFRGDYTVDFNYFN